MTGNPQFTCPPPFGLFSALAVDLFNIVVEQGGVVVSEVDSTLPFDVSATLRVGSIATLVHIPFEITYFFTAFGGGTSGTLGSTVGKFLDDPGGVFIAGCGLAKEYGAAVTRITVNPNPLAQDVTYQITAVADFPSFDNVDGFTAPSIVHGGP